MNTKEIEGYNGYNVSEDGTILSNKQRKPRKLKPQRATKSKKGYYQTRLYDGSGAKGILYYIHRIVWEAFKGYIPYGYEIDHMDGDTTNNKLTNLQLLTPRNNKNKHQRENQNYLLRDRRTEIIQDYIELGTFKKVAEKWGVSITAVNRVVRNRTHYLMANGNYGTRPYDIDLTDEWTLN